MKTTYEFPEPPEEPEHLSSLFFPGDGAPAVADTVPADWVAAEVGGLGGRAVDVRPEWLPALPPTSEAIRRELGASALPDWLIELGAPNGADDPASLPQRIEDPEALGAKSWADGEDAAEMAFGPESPDEDLSA